MKKAKVKNNYLEEIILIILFILFIILSFLCFKKSIIIQREQNVFYEEIGSPNYKIYLKDNNYYKQDYLDKDMSYIANLIDYISINYNYKFIIIINIKIAFLVRCYFIIKYCIMDTIFSI